MNTDYRYQLETRRLTGRPQQKTACPHCGRPKCFVRYVDTHNNFSYLHDAVGKCDHEHSCGYHYKPSDYYRDNAWLRDNPVPRIVQNPPQPKPLPPLQPLSMELVSQYHSPQSTFWQWFAGNCARRLNIDEAAVRRVYEEYCIGADERGNVIFWQIDALGRLRTGHIMQYQQDGHRHGGYQDWMHSKLIRQGRLSSDWPLYQCLFGEHLLRLKPEARVCLVESEKTALVMAAWQPRFLWLATCGSSGLSPEKVECLRGRRVTIFPDSGCYAKWKEKMQPVTGIDYYIVASMESHPYNTDLCDLLMDEAEHPP